MFFLQAKLSLRLEYIPPKPAKSVEGEIFAGDETDLGAELGQVDQGFEEEFGDEAEEGMEGVGDPVR